MLDKFLETKPLYYDEIDYDRFPRIYKKIQHNFATQKVIHLVGTNGKGTTGRFLASALNNLGFSVGHYTSPHILKFNERIWINGVDVIDEELEIAHKELSEILEDDDKEALSYFEYTTLLGMLIFKDCEYVVLEAGLGGEFDATAVFKKVLTLVTPIDIDHEAFLGSSVKEIATTKLNAIQNNAILAIQKYDDVYDVASQIAKAKELNIKKVSDYLNEKDYENISLISTKLKLAPYLEKNLSLSISALKFLNINYDLNSFDNSRLFGRLSKFRDNITIDVGHNVLAAKSILESLREDKYILVYNSYKDKDYKQILSILKPIILRVEIISISGQRGASLESLHEALNDLGIEYRKYNKIDKNNKYLVFGSFSVAESFLREYNE